MKERPNEKMELCFLTKIILLDCLINVRSHISSLCFFHHTSAEYSSVCEAQNLSCPQGELIFIKDVVYTRSDSSTNQCGDCFNGSSSPAQVYPVLFTESLYYECALREDCSLNASVCTPNELKDSLWYANITYDCIRGDEIGSMCLPWETLNEALNLHITLSSVTLPDLCTCVIYGDVGSVNISIIAYMPYSDGYACSGSSLYVNGKLHYCSTTTSENFSVYNTPLNITSNVTNLTLSVNHSLPRLFWFHVEGSLGVKVVCNGGDGHTSVSITSTSQTQTISTTSSVTQTTTEGASPVTDTKPTLSSSHSDDSKDNTIPVSTIAGASVGITALVLIVLIVVFLYKRGRTIDAKNEGNIYTAVHFDKTKKKKRFTTNGVSNESYKAEYENNINISIRPNGLEKDIQCIDSEPIEAEFDGIYAIAADTVSHSACSHTAMDGSDYTVGDYQEPYITFPKENDNDFRYEKQKPFGVNINAYNNLADIDTYSHIHNTTADQISQYSHIKNLQNQGNAMPLDHTDNPYNHLTPNINRQNSNDNQPLEEDTYNTILEDYDHLGHFSYT